MKVLFELRPAFDGHAGIPQETRLLFRGLQSLEGVDVHGLLQSSNLLLAKGLPSGAKHWPEHRRINRQSRVVVSASPGRGPTALDAARGAWMFGTGLLGRPTPLGHFEGHHFQDFLWRSLFMKTLAASDFDAITRMPYRVLPLPWSGLHRGALALRHLCGRPQYPRINTGDFDVLVAETPFPGRVTGRTQLVIRYHDAIPVLMPHSIKDRRHHQAAHYEALRRNVDDGAWFACVSDATRHDLLAMFPQAASRAVTIPNMVPEHYRLEESVPERVLDILLTRRHRSLRKPSANLKALPSGSTASAPRYLLMVATLEPRKNHLALLSAWERLRRGGDDNLQLVLVGSPGWHHKPIVHKFEPWLEQGVLHLLENVPMEELRTLYHHAVATVCPSFGEGFDFPGVEAMRCGSVVVASDLAVHREVFDDAAVYFNPYDVDSLVQSLAPLLSGDDETRLTRHALRTRGQAVAHKFRPEEVLPKWSSFLGSLRPASESAL